MFSHPPLEILDRLERHIILSIPEIHERTGVSAVIRNHDFDRTVWIDLRPRRRLAAPGHYECKSQCDKRPHTTILIPQWREKNISINSNDSVYPNYTKE